MTNDEQIHGLQVVITAHDEQGDSLAQLMQQAAERVSQLAGNQLYFVAQSQEDSKVIFISEVWRTQEAHQASLNDEQVRLIINQAKPLIANMEFTPTKPIQTKN